MVQAVQLGQFLRVLIFSYNLSLLELITMDLSTLYVAGKKMDPIKRSKIRENIILKKFSSIAILLLVLITNGIIWYLSFISTTGNISGMKKIAIIMGTRPEIIKIAPVIKELQSRNKFAITVIFTGQHDSMAEQAFASFCIKPDYNLALMQENQGSNELLGTLLPTLEKILNEISPCGVIVQGDTTSALGGALAAFYLKIPVAHIEAGLRTFNFSSPFPEEMNRVLISKLSTIHFCPTKLSSENLQNEGIKENTFIVGNTIVDALLEMRNKESADDELKFILNTSDKILLVTGHRRENFDQPLKNLCQALIKLAENIPNLRILFPVHLNPQVQNTVYQELKNKKGIYLLAPLDYPSLLYVLKRSSLVITDSGGIQEEAPSFGVRVLITRTITERPEAVLAGCAEILSLDNSESIYQRTFEELNVPLSFPKITSNPFGDGRSAERIVKILEKSWS